MKDPKSLLVTLTVDRRELTVEIYDPKDSVVTTRFFDYDDPDTERQIGMEIRNSIKGTWDDAVDESTEW